jgi:hypothetical protein
MLYDEIADPETVTPANLAARYQAAVADVVDEFGIDAVADRTGLDRDAVATLADETAETVLLADAAAVLALRDGAPDTDTILAEARDHLLLGMTTAVLDVEAIAADVEADLRPRAIQQKVEGRAPMTLAEYAAVQHYIASQKRR